VVLSLPRRWRNGLNFPVRVQRLSCALWLFWQRRWLGYGSSLRILVLLSLHRLLFSFARQYVCYQYCAWTYEACAHKAYWCRCFLHALLRRSSNCSIVCAFEVTVSELLHEGQDYTTTRPLPLQTRCCWSAMSVCVYIGLWPPGNTSCIFPHIFHFEYHLMQMDSATESDTPLAIYLLTLAHTMLLTLPL
jgi:hypothetical protein